MPVIGNATLPAAGVPYWPPGKPAPAPPGEVPDAATPGIGPDMPKPLGG